MVWWFNTKVALHNGSSSHGGKHSVNSNSHASQHACSSLCDEIVILWRLAALNPGLSPEERDLLINQFKRWHIKIVDKVRYTNFLNFYAFDLRPKKWLVKMVKRLRLKLEKNVITN